MLKNKYLIIAFFSLVALSFSYMSKKSSGPDFTIVKCTQQLRHAGIKNGFTGHYYNITLVKKTSALLKFDSIYVMGGMPCAVDLDYDFAGPKSFESLKVNDTIHLAGRLNAIDVMAYMKTKEIKKEPISADLLVYHKEANRKSIVLPAFTKLEALRAK